MIASKLNRSILRSGYLVTPAWRSWRTNGTAVCVKPIQTVIPRRKRLRSGIASSASSARRSISRKSPDSTARSRPVSRRNVR